MSIEEVLKAFSLHKKKGLSNEEVRKIINNLKFNKKFLESDYP